MLFALQPAQDTQLSATQGMHRRRAVLAPVDVQSATAKIDLVPFQGDSLDRAQPMSVRGQDHRGIAVAVASAASGRDQLLNFGIGQVLARAQLGVRPPLGRALPICPVNSAWRDQRQTRLFH